MGGSKIMISQILKSPPITARWSAAPALAEHPSHSLVMVNQGSLLSVAVGPLPRPPTPRQDTEASSLENWSSQKQGPKNAEMGDPQPAPPRPPFSGAQGSVLTHPWEPGDSLMMYILNFDK